MNRQCVLGGNGRILLACVFLAGLAAGCSTDTEMGGVRIPNVAPDTRVTGQPPTLLEASYAVEFRWTGSDPDGKIIGFQWKISDNGTDGISPQDTLTVDPLTGALLHPWNFTTGTDSTFLVLADQAGFPGDTHGSPRSYRSHSLFVRAIDDKGAVDPSPAYISFTSTTLVPTCRVSFPGLQGTGAYPVPRTVNIGWEGSDDDFELRVPTKVRFLWKPARDAANNWINSQYSYQQDNGRSLSFDDPNWSQWLPYRAEPKDRMVSIPNQAVNEYFLFAVQVQDTAGAVSVGRGYQAEVANLVTRDRYYRPELFVAEPYLGVAAASEAFNEIAGGQPLNFNWLATASSYNGKIASLRHGWDLVDVNDPNDPGWAVSPGLSAQNLRATERSFTDGLHTFTVRVEDDAGQVLVFKWTLRVVPFVAVAFQLPLLVLDQINDATTNSWPDQSGNARYRQEFRNAYWHFLAEGAGGVADFTWERDWRDHPRPVSYADLVPYRAVLCYAQSSASQTLFSQFRPRGRTEKYVWLTPYQQRGGNLMLVGAQSMDSFLESVSNYMVPMVFDTREETYTIFGISFISGFGTLTLPDGNRVLRGPRMYPYATVGIAALDWSAPSSKVIYGRNVPANNDRASSCVGIKALVLAPAFKANHLIGPGVVPDTLYTNATIDWQDRRSAQADTLGLFHKTFPYGNDEFVDGNISPRTTPITPQECSSERYPAGIVPNGRCIEPMFTGVSRIDWMREYHRERGRLDWPQSQYTDKQLDDGCGRLALTEYQGRQRASGRTNGMVFGYMSYKSIPDKPGQKADVYWGFDPYRFDAQGSKKAIRWVLEYFGLQINE